MKFSSKQILLLPALLSVILSPGQNIKCSCADNFEFVRKYLQQNHAAFSDNVTTARQGEYKALSTTILKEIKQDSGKTNCSYFIEEYLRFFKDKHIYIRTKSIPVDENDSVAVAVIKASENYKKTEWVTLNTGQINRLNKKSLQEVEGIYHSFLYPGYTIALIKAGLKYKGVIVESSSVLWRPGQVKFILTPEADNLFDATLSLKDHSKQRKRVSFYNGTFEDLYFSKNPQKENNEGVFEFNRLNDSTCYLRVSSFLGSYFNLLDSCYKKHYDEITSTPYLVIDVRDNAGGSDDCYQGLIDFIYTNPIVSDVLDMYVTPANLAIYQNELSKMLNDSSSYGSDAISSMRGYVEKMKMAKQNSFIPMDSAEYTTRSETLRFPKKVAVVYNRNSASSCEGFIFSAMQSKKVTTFGENSAGYTGYGNVFAVDVPNSNLMLGCTTTRYQYRRKFDGVGIPPKYRLLFNKNWIEDVLRKLCKK